jgi:Glycosyl transferase family 11
MSCNHTIITRGTFTMWAAVLAGGEYYTEYGTIIPQEMMNP